MRGKASLCVVLCTVPDLKTGRHLAGLLLEKKLAACVSLLPGLESHYVWKGKRERGREILLLIKTKASTYKQLEKTILSEHPYECPEIIALESFRQFRGYLEWVEFHV